MVDSLKVFFRSLGAAACGLLMFSPSLHGQASSATAHNGRELQVGGYYSWVHSDYSPEHYNGFGGYATFDFLPNWGAEVNIRQAKTSGDQQMYERTFEGGLRYVVRAGRFNPYARISAGRGIFNFPQNRANSGYGLFSVGAGLDYNVLAHLNVRGDYEYQHWRNFPVSDSLTPQLVSVGVAYRF